MTEFVESLTRMYQDGKVTDVILKRLLESKKISNEEFNYIKKGVNDQNCTQF